MDLADLKTSISNLSDEQLMTTLMGIRANRRVSTPSKPTSIESLLASASPDMIAQMIEALEKGKK
jgi:hypothetical protein